MAAPSGIPAANRSLVLAPERELFASLIASGFSTRQAAERCGFDADYGWDLSHKPDVKARITELAEDSNEAVKRSIRAELQILRQRAAQFGDDVNVRAEIACRLQVLMAAAKLEGMVIDRKQVDKRSVSANLRLGRAEAAELEAALEADLNRLAPGATSQLARLGRPAKPGDLKAIAAGETVDAKPQASRIRK